MEQRVSLVTLAVRDVAASRAFYLDGLGWRAHVDVPGEVVMVQVGEHLLLSLWSEAGFEAEVGPVRRGEGLAPVTLAHNVGSREEVDAVLATARAAGASPVSGAVDREWGGYSGYFADPDGFRWEVAWAPGPVGDLVVP
ncbi:VOC family protein [Nocardioides ferulae]|uniref:VOC family protein n=1 Tax=Nocardioides ferulae TaxID=2340821 RepID=UPI000EB03FCB|nr:VOC family protein [Nocardioides ferulae]